MSEFYTVAVAVLAVLAVSGLYVGVTNDAVNFLNSAIGSKAAGMRTILAVASVGIILGVISSSGMMEVARNGMFNPSFFTFGEVMAIYLGVMLANVILLDIYNSMGLPTSTTVSLIFCLLGAAVAVSAYKISSEPTLSAGDLGDFINTSRAMGIISAILLSVAIAFTCGTVTMWISRMIFSFRYMALFRRFGAMWCGVSLTAIVYFALFKGLKSTFAESAAAVWIDHNLPAALALCWVACSVLLAFLQLFRINILRITILSGTFALALAFAGNDLVNFIGVPVAGFDAYSIAREAGNTDVVMSALNENIPANMIFMLTAGAVMVLTLWTSRKAMHVTETEISLSAQSSDDESQYGSNVFSRGIVRLSINAATAIERVTPLKVREFVARRFEYVDVEHSGAPYDMIRATVNLTTSALLISLATSLKLPLSTTYVCFMVAMGSSLADRAWGRESAVFRITGVISVIGGWFLTAGAAFIGAGLIVLAMHFGGHWVMFALAALTVFLIVRSNRRFRKKKEEEKGDTLFQTILATDDEARSWDLTLVYITDRQREFIAYARDTYRGITDAFIGENAGVLSKADKSLALRKRMLKNERRKETLCMRRVSRRTALEKNAWFHLSNNCCMSILYNLRRIDEACKEHVENNFKPLPPTYVEDFELIRERILTLLDDTLALTATGSVEAIPTLRRHVEEIKDSLSDAYHALFERLHEGDPTDMTVLYVYINILQESREMVSTLRKYLRAYAKLRDSEFSGRAR